LSGSALYQTITVSGGFFAYTFGAVKMDILTSWECFGFGTIFILLAILRNRIGNRLTTKKEPLSQKPPESDISESMQTGLRLFLGRSKADRIIRRSKK